MATQTLYFRDAQSPVALASGFGNNSLLSTSIGAGTVITTAPITNAKLTGFFQAQPKATQATAAPVAFYNNAGWMFDAGGIGTYDAGTWTWTFEGQSNSTSGTMTVQLAAYVVSVTPTNITNVLTLVETAASGTWAHGTINTNFTATATFNPGAFFVGAGQYLYVQYYLNVSVAGTSTTGSVKIATDDPTSTTATRLVTANFNPGPAPYQPNYQRAPVMAM